MTCQVARRAACAAGLACLPLCGAGCGGGLPLLHPARVLPRGEVQAAGGFSGTIAPGALGSAVENAANEAAANPGTVPTDTTFARGALVAASVAPGLAPFVGARVGLGVQSEAGLAYTGRAARADVRHAFDLSDAWTLSVGVGGSGALNDHGSAQVLPNVALNDLTGWGADVPVLLGYSSEGDLYSFWFGPRAGWEHVSIRLASSETPLGAQPISLSATRFWGGAVVGAAVGFRHVHVAVELDASYANITGEYGGTNAQVSGVSLAPSTALWWHF